jgi:Ni/Co efflux regulator RcnB
METSMNYKAVISAIMAMSLTTGGWAFAKDDGDRNDRGRNEQSQRGNQQDRRDNDRRDDRHDNGRRDNQGRGNHDERSDHRGAGPNHAYHKGDRLPVEYRHRHYVVDDWRGHQLSAPPRGYHWVQTGNDYVLVAIATGIILQLFLSN